MKFPKYIKILIIQNVALILLYITVESFAQPCTTSDASGCSCKNASSTDCDLLPDITVAEPPLLVTGSNGVIEYSQTGNGANNGRLRISVSTPNIGHGPLETRATNIFICGTDTFYSDPGTCPGTGDPPRNLVVQRIYHKSGNTMTYYDRPAGSMTYHASHGHMHIDDWGIYTLRIRDTLEPNPLNWPIVGTGSKLGFCLMDYGSCSTYSGHCVDSAGNVLLNGDFPNYGLGGGNYSCSPVVQGISSGWTDIYYQYLDGMWIDIPPGTCNGQYYIVVHVDPYNYFLEENEDNNVLAVPITLTQQQPGATASITPSNTSLCDSDTITLTANTAFSYQWSNGATTQSIQITDGGVYRVTITNQCGSASDSVMIQEGAKVYQADDVVLCEPGQALLTASGNGTIRWYDAPTGGNLLDTGSTFLTPVIQSTTTYFVESERVVPGSIHFSKPHYHTGSSQYSANTYNGYIIFDVYKACILKSVKVYTDQAGIRTIELRDQNGNVLDDTTLMITPDSMRITLNFRLNPGSNLQLGTNTTQNQSSFGFDSPRLKRSNNASYPYNLLDILSLKDSPFGTSYYYYFYDWEVKEDDQVCVSPRMDVTITFSQPPVIQVNGDTLQTATAQSYQWYYNGSAIAGANSQTLIASQTGYYQVEVLNNDNCILISDSVYVNSSMACQPSDSLYTTRITPTTAMLNWTAVSGAHHYQIRGRIEGNSNWVYLNVPYNNPTRKVVSGLTNNTTYEWQVKTFCDEQETMYSAWSPPATFTTGCKMPAEHWADPVVSNAAQLNWTRVAGAVGYEIRGRKLGGNWINIIAGGNSTASKVIYGLSPNTTYQWRIRAWCDEQGIWKSPYSTIDTFTTTGSNNRLADNGDARSNDMMTFLVYPNPARDILQVEMPAPFTDVRVYLADLQGRVIATADMSLPKHLLTIHTSKIPNGLYQLIIERDGMTRIEKVAIMH